MTSHDPTRSRNTPSADVSRASAALLPQPHRRRRPPFALAAAAIFATGLATHYLLTGWFADALADGLYTALIAVTIVLIAPRLRPWVAATAAFALSAAVELLRPHSPNPCPSPASSSGRPSHRSTSCSTPSRPSSSACWMPQPSVRAAPPHPGWG
jgi:hypothetical protein